MKVYVKTDAKNRIIAVDSTAFISDISGWTKIDEGDGDKYFHAQAHYFPLPLTDDNGIYRYKLAAGVAIERTAEEIAADLAAIPEPPYQPTDVERLDALEAAVLELILAREV